MLPELLQERLAGLQPYITKNKLEAFRLWQPTYELPIAIDIYKHAAVFHLFEPISAQTKKECEATLRTLLNIKSFFYKDRLKAAGQPMDDKNFEKITVNEYGNIFEVNLSNYLDTGLFLDHRETRRWVGEQSKGKIVLNTFAYTGTFSVYAARGGAQKTYTVDLSKTYCDWTRRNLELNNLPPEQNWIYKMDTREFFRYALRKKLTFDIIIIDPPTFSRNKGLSFSVQKDHPELINAALEILSPKGFIVFSNNFQEFKLNKKELKGAQVEEKFDTIPLDFEPLCAHHCFIIRHI